MSARVQPDPDSVRVERHGPVTVLTLDRPSCLNALSMGLLARFEQLLAELADSPEQRVVVLAGAGRAFCAGIDLADLEAGRTWVQGVGPVQATYALQQAVGRVVVGFREIPQPVVAAVGGTAAGGGLSLACAADLRLGTDRTRFLPSFVRLGTSGGDMGSSWLLPRIVGWERAAEVLYTGRSIEADEALESGLVSRLVPADVLVDEAVALAEQMCTTSPFGLRLTKSLLNTSRDGLSLRHQLEMENRTQVMTTATADFAEGARAAFERRDPVFRDA